MSKRIFPKIRSFVQLYDIIPETERVIVDILRQLVVENLPAYCKEKISFNVPFFYGNKGICIIWPASVPGGGVKEGVLLGFWYGYLLEDPDHYLDRGTNKQIFYKIFKSVEDIDEKSIKKIIMAAVELDQSFIERKR